MKIGAIVLGAFLIVSIIMFEILSWFSPNYEITESDYIGVWQLEGIKEFSDSEEFLDGYSFEGDLSKREDNRGVKV